jgi:hypothetical protein
MLLARGVDTPTWAPASSFHPQRQGPLVRDKTDASNLDMTGRL